MKERIKIDSSLLSFVIILTGFLYLMPNLYPQSMLLDTILDFVGMIFVFKGVFLRMVARGHKKAHSQKSQSLVTSGPYTLVRNPMYLGSFLLGLGFILMVWPWWAAPVFAFLFYQRFKRQVAKEEVFLGETFGQAYRDYCSRTPRIFPSIKTCLPGKVNLAEVCNVAEALSTKERRGLFTWPLLAVFMETFQEGIVFRVFDMGHTVFIILAAAAVFGGTFILLYPYASVGVGKDSER